MPITGRPPPASGFTLLELLITMAIVVILTRIAVPAMTQFVTANRMASQANALVTALNYARSEAVGSARTVAVCPYQGGRDGAPYSCKDSTVWRDGWIVYRPVLSVTGAATGDTEVLRVFKPLQQGDSLDGSARLISYQPSGFLGNASAPTFAMTPSPCRHDQKRRITLSIQGRPNVSKVACDG